MHCCLVVVKKEIDSVRDEKERGGAAKSCVSCSTRPTVVCTLCLLFRPPWLVGKEPRFVLVFPWDATAYSVLLDVSEGGLF